MSAPPSTDDVVRALGELGRGAVPVEEAGRAGYRRERIVRVLARQLDARNAVRPERKRVWLGVALAALVVLGIGVSVALLHTPAPTAVVANTPAGEVRAIVGDVSIRRGDKPARAALVGDVFQGGETVLTARGSSLEIGIESGRARLSAESDLEVVRPSSSERRLRLDKGGVDVDLPSKLVRGGHLVIETPDAEVVVVGTAFSVDLRQEKTGSLTVVAVRRGTVWIRRDGQQEAVLKPGDTWRSRLETSDPVPVVVTETELAPVRRQAVRSPAPPSRAKESGTLAEENRLFEAGLSARNAGQHAAAAENFRTLLSRYPATVLAEQALAGQFRSLERAGRLSTAIVAARRYLASYPKGFARADAERLTTSSLGER
jgi:hypothetical protein